MVGNAKEVREVRGKKAKKFEWSKWRPRLSTVLRQFRASDANANANEADKTKETDEIRQRRLNFGRVVSNTHKSKKYEQQRRDRRAREKLVKIRIVMGFEFFILCAAALSLTRIYLIDVSGNINEMEAWWQQQQKELPKSFVAFCDECKEAILTLPVPLDDDDDICIHWQSVLSPPQQDSIQEDAVLLNHQSQQVSPHLPDLPLDIMNYSGSQRPQNSGTTEFPIDMSYLPPNYILGSSGFVFTTIKKAALLKVIETLPDEIQVAHSFYSNSQPFAFIPINDELSECSDPSLISPQSCESASPQIS